MEDWQQWTAPVQCYRKAEFPGILVGMDLNHIAWQAPQQNVIDHINMIVTGAGKLWHVQNNTEGHNWAKHSARGIGSDCHA